jgi:hypothetical protein
VADPKRHSAVVREYGRQQVESALVRVEEWKTWAEQLDELIREMPGRFVPRAYDEDGECDQVDMGAHHVEPLAMRTRLYGVVADADALAAALTRAAVLVEQKSTDLADSLEDDECRGCGLLSYACSWSQTSVAGPGDCCDDCSHAESDEGSEPRG